MSEFTEALGQIYERHAEEMQHLVSSFRKKNSELRKERPACPSSLFHTWETLLQEVEIDSQAHSDIANILGRQVRNDENNCFFFKRAVSYFMAILGRREINVIMMSEPIKSRLCFCRYLGR